MGGTLGGVERGEVQRMLMPAYIPAVTSFTYRCSWRHVVLALKTVVANAVCVRTPLFAGVRTASSLADGSSRSGLRLGMWGSCHHGRVTALDSALMVVRLKLDRAVRGPWSAAWAGRGSRVGSMGGGGRSTSCRIGNPQESVDGAQS